MINPIVTNETMAKPELIKNNFNDLPSNKYNTPKKAEIKPSPVKKEALIQNIISTLVPKNIARLNAIIKFNNAAPVKILNWLRFVKSSSVNPNSDIHVFPKNGPYQIPPTTKVEIAAAKIDNQFSCENADVMSITILSQLD